MTAARWVLVLPFPTPPLSLNDRGQTPAARAHVSRVKREVRHAVAVLARAEGVPSVHAVHVRLHYRPRDRRRRDADNLVATLKPCLDGLVDAGVILDDTPEHLDWSAPRIHEPSPDRVSALWLEVTSVGGAR